MYIRLTGPVRLVVDVVGVLSKMVVLKLFLDFLFLVGSLQGGCGKGFLLKTEGWVGFRILSEAGRRF